MWFVCNKKVSVKGSCLFEFLLDKKWRVRVVDGGGIRCMMCNVFYDFCDCGRVLSDLYVYIEREGREGWDDYWNLYVKGRGNIFVLY